MSVSWEFLRGYGDRREEASFASKPVGYIKDKKSKIRKMVENWSRDWSSVCYVLVLYASPKIDH